MQKKVLLLATFLKSDQTENFLQYLSTKFNINDNDVFKFEMEDGTLIYTYRIKLGFGERIDIKRDLNNTIQVHKKGDCLFTINAMNKLIEKETQIGGGNIHYHNHKLDWDKYQNKILLIKNMELNIANIKRIFP